MAAEMPRCKTCKHWKAEGQQYGSHRFGACTLVGILASFEIIRDVEGGAELETEANFGCVEHEERSE